MPKRTPPTPPVARRRRLHLQRALRDLRANLRYRLGQGVARLRGARIDTGRLPVQEIESVLVCRLNARIGNTLFLTPLIRRLHALLPHAMLDVALSNPAGEDLLARMPGVRRVITFPHKGVGLPARYLAALSRLRAERYDLAIDPTPSSTSARILLTAARARFRLGFANPDQWAPLTHAVPAPAPGVHQAVQPVQLLAQAIGAPFDAHEVRLDLALQPEELAEGRAALAQVLGSVPTLGATNPLFGFFAHATALKTLDRRYWVEFWDAFLALEPQARPIEFLPGPHTAPTVPRFASLHIRSPRALAATIAATRLFISADTGPMHLASATTVPTVALFCATDPALYGPLKPSDLALEVAQYPPQLAARRCQLLWREGAARAPGIRERA